MQSNLYNNWNLDAIYFSTHKFLGGAGTPGVLIFNKKIYHNNIPDQRGGGTVLYSNPWKVHEYINAIEQREDGGTPPFLGAIKTARCVQLKEAMGINNIVRREEEILQIMLKRLLAINNIKLLEEKQTIRLGIISFIVQEAPYNLFVQMLNDRFGIQA